MSSEDETRRLVQAVTDFLQNELHRTDFSNEDRDNLRNCIECLEIVYGLQEGGYSFRRSLLDMYSQAANPVTVKDKVKAEESKNSGNEKMAQGMFQEAEVDYTQAIQLDKWNSIYFCNRSAARIKLGQYHDAILDCRRALELNPDYAKAYGRMGQAYIQLDRPRSAVSCFQQAARLEPENPQHENNLRVAQRQVAERNNSGLDGFFTSLLGLLTSRRSPPPTRPPEGGRLSPSFVILSDPHRPEDCPLHQSRSSTDTENSGDQSQQAVEGGDQSSESSRDDNTVHFTMLVGIPSYSEEEGTAPNHPLFSNPSTMNDESGGDSSVGETLSPTSSSGNSEYASADSDPFKEMVDSVAEEIRSSNEQRCAASANSEERSEESNPGGSGGEGSDKGGSGTEGSEKGGSGTEGSDKECSGTEGSKKEGSDKGGSGGEGSDNENTSTGEKKDPLII